MMAYRQVYDVCGMAASANGKISIELHIFVVCPYNKKICESSKTLTVLSCLKPIEETKWRYKKMELRVKASRRAARAIREAA